jgi:pilus assembly protein CpaC
MHRTRYVPRPRAWGLIIGLLLAAGAGHAAAQPEVLPQPGGGPPVAAPADPQSRTEVLGINQTRRIGMTSRAPIVGIENENPAVVRIDKVDKDPTTVFVTGTARGVARLVFTDINKRTEIVLLRVDDTEQKRLELIDLIRQVAPTAVVQVNVAPNNTVILTGVVTDVDTAQRLMEAARAVFTYRDGVAVVAPNVFNGMRVGGVQQVQLEVVVAAVNRSRLRQMAFNFFANGNHFVFNSSFLAGNFTNALTTTPTAATGNLVSTPNLTFGILSDNHSFSAFLQALTTEQLTKILADTRLVTVSGRPAFLTSGGETPILTSSGVGAPSVTYKQFGTVTNFLPIVENGKIHLEVRAEISDLNNAFGITLPGSTATNVPGFSSRLAQCAVQLEDGQTLAIGGLIQNKINATIQRIPVLGDLPFLNVFFTTKSYNEQEEEMLILVTPRLVDGMACTQIPKYLPGRETRSPDDFELFLEGIMEAPRGPRVVSAHPSQYKGAHMNSPNAGAIPCAGAGYLGSTGAGCAGGQCGAGPAVGYPIAPAAAAPAAYETRVGDLPAAPLPHAVAPAAAPADLAPPVRDAALPPPAEPAVPRSLDFRTPLPPGNVPPAGDDR